MPSIPVHLATSYSEIAHLMDGPYNPPVLRTEEDGRRYEEEYERFRNGLIAILEPRGKISPYEDGDFSVGHRTGPTRGVGVVISKSAFFPPALLWEIKQYVDNFPEKYVVAISGERKPGEDYYVGVTPDAVLPIFTLSTEYLPAWLAEHSRR